jgi:ATP-dependent RNA helicase DDX35
MSAPGFWKPAPTATSFLQGQLKEESRNDEDWAPVFSKSRAPLAQQRLLLPIYKHRRQIIYALEDFGVVIVVGETGSGKSTQIPQYLVESGWAENDFQIVCTQPRRIAAITLAQRVAEEAGTDVGNSVGYSVRFDDQSSPNTQIKYVTDGMLLREATVVDPLLSNYSVVMVDEAHERNLNSDAVLGLIKKIRRKRKDLRVIVCSATIDAQAFLEFFIGKTDETTTASAPKRKRRWGPRVGEKTESPVQPVEESPPSRGTIISVDGRQHSVDVLYFAQPASDYIHATVETAWKIYREDNSGDILCFLPSGEDIDRAIRIAEEQFEEHTQSVDFLPLYGTLPYHMQARVFQPNENQKQATRRRIIFATNIAETSVTVPGITHVIDTGLVKLPYFDPKTGLDRLIVGPTSQASARQRAGRSGRVRSGKCYRLYTEQYLLKDMKPQTAPEILRTNLTSFILTLKALGVDNILAFDLMDVPSVDALSHGLESLYALGAIDDKTHLTKLGLDMSAFPTEPRISRMLLESLDAGCSWEVLAVASTLQVRDLFHRPRSRRPQQLLDYETAMSEIADTSGDHVTYANLMSEMDDRDMDQEECKDKFINYVALRRAMEVRKQLARFLRRFGRVEAMGLVGAGDGLARSKAIRRCVTAGFFFNVAKLANDGRYYTLRKHILVTPATSSVFSSHSTGSSEYVVFGETFDGPRGGIELRSVSAIDARWLRELAPHYWE